MNDTDVWRKLSSNWNHFFWLTGETPDTLDVLIDRLKARMNVFRRTGRISFMTTRNQVTQNIFLAVVHWMIVSG